MPVMDTELAALVKSHEKAVAALDAAKAACGKACVDETVHAPHRARLEAAYAAAAEAGNARNAAEAKAAAKALAESVGLKVVES